MTALKSDLKAGLEGHRMDQERMKSSLLIGIAGVAGLIIAVVTGFFGGSGAGP